MVEQVTFAKQACSKAPFMPVLSVCSHATHINLIEHLTHFLACLMHPAQQLGLLILSPIYECSRKDWTAVSDHD